MSDMPRKIYAQEMNDKYKAAAELVEKLERELKAIYIWSGSAAEGAGMPEFEHFIDIESKAYTAIEIIKQWRKEI